MKQAEKVDTKVVWLLSPDAIGGSGNILDSLHIHKSAKGIDYTVSVFSRQEINKYYATLPPGAREVLQQFNAATFFEVKQEMLHKFSKQKADTPVDAMVRNAMLRHVHQLFERLKPYFLLNKWYHRTRLPDSKQLKTSPCSFSDLRPQLRFDVIRENNRFSARIVFAINQQVIEQGNYHLYHFLLESNNQYYLLYFKDYQTLQWLEQSQSDEVCSDAAMFSQHILARLSDGYTVNRNDLFEEKKLEALPISRVVLSELNNTFLLMTPQWLYEGIVVDGPYKETYEALIGGQKLVIARHQETEQNFLQLLQSLHPKFESQRNGYYYLSFAEAEKKQWFLNAYHKLLEKDIEVVGMDLLQHFRYSPHRAQTTMAIKKEEGSRVVFHFSVRFGEEEVSLTVLQKTLYAGQRAVMLKDGSLGILSEEWMAQYASLVKHGRVAQKNLEVARFMAITETRLAEEQPVIKPLIKNTWWQKWQQWQVGTASVYEVPSLIRAELRPYQQQGFEWLALLAEAGAGGCLADDMGLGKTLQTICFLAWYIEQYPAAAHLIVCPTSLIHNWQQEIKKFAPSLQVVVYYGAGRTAEDLSKDQTQIIITSYGTLKSDSEILLTKNYGVAIIDESHNIKNPSAQISRVMHQVDANIRIALSGTPVVNNTFDLYSQLNFALPGMFGTREFFKREYAEPIDRFQDEIKIKALQRMTAPFILRRTKEQVAKDLPAKTESILWCTMSSAQEELYNEVKDQIRSNLFLDIKNNGLNKSKLAVLQGLLKLRQICSHPQLLSLEEHKGCKESVKTEVLIEELTNLLGHHKVLVFSQFSSMLHLLQQECQAKGISSFLLDGQTPADRRMQMVNEFQQKDNSPHLFLISLKAGNTGLTLTAADYVFLFDPWWNAAVEQQAIDRTYRIGQTKSVFAYKLICKDSVEEKIIELQQRKKHLAQELIVQEDELVKTLSEDDIAYLFS